MRMARRRRRRRRKKIRECETITPGFCCCCFCFYDTPPIKSTFTGTRDPDRSHVSQSNLIKRPTPRREKGAHDTPKERERGESGLGERLGFQVWSSEETHSPLGQLNKHIWRLIYLWPCVYIHSASSDRLDESSALHETQLRCYSSFCLSTTTTQHYYESAVYNKLASCRVYTHMNAKFPLYAIISFFFFLGPTSSDSSLALHQSSRWELRSWA